MSVDFLIESTNTGGFICSGNAFLYNVPCTDTANNDPYYTSETAHKVWKTYSSVSSSFTLSLDLTSSFNFPCSIGTKCCYRIKLIPDNGSSCNPNNNSNEWTWTKYPIEITRNE